LRVDRSNMPVPSRLTVALGSAGTKQRVDLHAFMDILLQRCAAADEMATGKFLYVSASITHLLGH
jgi:hypothetical protein